MSHLYVSPSYRTGHLYGGGIVDDEGDTEILVGDGTKVKPAKSTFFIPQIALHEEDGREKKRVLVYVSVVCLFGVVFVIRQDLFLTLKLTYG